MIKRDLTGAIMGNRWWVNLKDSIRSFATDYGRRLKSAMVAEQRSIKDKLDRAVLAGDSGQVNVAKTDLASLQIKEYQALVVRARLKRMSCEATNMAQELRAEELRHATDRHIASVSTPDDPRYPTASTCNLFMSSPRTSTHSHTHTFLPNLQHPETWFSFFLSFFLSFSLPLYHVRN